MNANPALEPSSSATVSASAGTGKTWSLVSRIIRILLEDADPGSILAITFTRKAAAEMQARLNDRLLELASSDSDGIRKQLLVIGAPDTNQMIVKARQLYEKILYSSYPPQIGTFHALCQDLLKRFPFDANVPPGFELTEQTAELESEAMDLLFTEATLNNNSDIAQALETLFTHSNGIHNVKLTLGNFLKHRSDWWAYTANQKAPVKYAISRLKEQLQLDVTEDPALNFFSPHLLLNLDEYACLLRKHDTATNRNTDLTVQEIMKLVDSNLHSQAFDRLEKIFFTEQRKQRAVKRDNKSQIKSMGEAGNLRFLELTENFVEAISSIIEIQKRQNTFVISSAWMTAGHQLLAIYQRIKEEQRILDFADLEWNACLLLTSENHAAWVQYKLDSRINHVLIDEFQDTNPTQWHLLQPLLEEICSSKNEPDRSIFLVGDTKQSIYRFRRAQPELFQIARNWISEHIQSNNTSLDESRRSAPAIIDFVNRIFSTGPLHEQIVNFEPHRTVLNDLWGRVTVIDMFSRSSVQHDEDTTDPELFRNPLKTPCQEDDDSRRIDEAEFIAAEISRLISMPAIVGSGSNARPLNYADIIILLRQRTHAGIYEKSLNAAGIPFAGINKGTLLDTLEIRDISALLNILITPYDNLAVAQVLKSPIFGCSDLILMSLASIKTKPWIEKLAVLAQNHPELHEIQRANKLLSNWQSLAGNLPVHDLLDRIYSESNLVQRYIAAFPSHLKYSVESNLNRFIELALEIDSGRYPSITRFLYRLTSLRDRQTDAPDELPAGKNSARVRLLTIHAAKGLEAPVIFLADSANSGNANDAYSAVVDWPANADRPDHFLLALKKDDQDELLKSVQTRHSIEIQREQANLLYVALTRAKQLLYITASAPGKNSDAGWYNAIVSQLSSFPDITVQPDGNYAFESNRMPSAFDSKVVHSNRIVNVEPGLTHPFSGIQTTRYLNPSQLIQRETNYGLSASSANENSDAQRRGIIIHKILQLLTENADTAGIKNRINEHYGRDIKPSQLNEYWEEALAVLKNPGLKYLFDETSVVNAYNEVPLLYEHNGYIINGVIDRLVVAEERVYLVDYKTTMIKQIPSPEELSGQYGLQMGMYLEGIKTIWPGKPVVTQILFTHSQKVIDIVPQSIEIPLHES